MRLPKLGWNEMTIRGAPLHPMKLSIAALHVRPLFISLCLESEPYLIIGLTIELHAIISTLVTNALLCISSNTCSALVQNCGALTIYPCIHYSYTYSEWRIAYLSCQCCGRLIVAMSIGQQGQGGSGKIVYVIPLDPSASR